jgi:hypothetical protein
MATHLEAEWLKYLLPCVAAFWSGWIAHVFTHRRDKLAASAKFRASFEPVLAYMKAGYFSDNHLVANSAIAQDECIGMFQVYVARRKRRRFNDDCEAYRQARFYAQNQQEMQVFTAEVTQEFIRAIEQLLTYAK